MTKKLQIGDIFEVPLKNNIKGYFQYIGIDYSELLTFTQLLDSGILLVYEHTSPSLSRSLAD
jgi:hypothetical protein